MFYRNFIGAILAALLGVTSGAKAESPSPPALARSTSCQFIVKIDPQFDDRIDGAYGTSSRGAISVGLLELFQQGGKSAYLAASPKALSPKLQIEAASIVVVVTPPNDNIEQFEGSEKDFASLLQGMRNKGGSCRAAMSISKLAVASTATWIGLEAHFMYFDNFGSFKKPFKKYKIVRLNLSKKDTVDPSAYQADLGQNLVTAVALFRADIQERQVVKVR